MEGAKMLDGEQWAAMYSTVFERRKRGGGGLVDEGM